MGKKSKRHGAHAGAVKPAAGSLINNKAICKTVEELWTKSQGQAPSALSALWRDYDAVVGLTDSLREKQGPPPNTLPPVREEGFPAFYQWLKTHNAEFDKVEVGTFKGVGFGMKAKQHIEMGERVMRIPEKLMLSSETAKTSQLGPLIARDRMLQVMPNVTLALHLLNERYNPKSFWKPYIDILPKSFSLPLWFDRSQMELLAGSPCLADALQHVRSVGKLYSHLHKLLRAHGDTSISLYSVGFYYEDFMWAVSAVMSRQNEIPHEKEEKKSKLALIPLWDMCNHWLGTISTDFNVELRTCDCFSPGAVEMGNELRIFYGARSNAELFLHQGFVYPPNIGDTLRIKLGLSSGEDSATKSMKSKILTKLDIPLSGVFHILAAEDPFTPQLKAFVRVFTAKSKDLQDYEELSQEELKKELLAEKWGKGDAGALEFLIQRCELLLKAYRSTLFEDFEKVANAKLDSKTHQAIMLTICERCILTSAGKMATAQKVLLERGLVGGVSHSNGSSIKELKEEEEEEEEREEEDGLAEATRENGVCGSSITEVKEEDEEEREEEEEEMKEDEEEREEDGLVEATRENGVCEAEEESELSTQLEVVKEKLRTEELMPYLDEDTEPGSSQEEREENEWSGERKNGEVEREGGKVDYRRRDGDEDGSKTEEMQNGREEDGEGTEGKEEEEGEINVTRKKEMEEEEEEEEENEDQSHKEVSARCEETGDNENRVLETDNKRRKDTGGGKESSEEVSQAAASSEDTPTDTPSEKG